MCSIRWMVVCQVLSRPRSLVPPSSNCSTISAGHAEKVTHLACTHEHAACRSAVVDWTARHARAHRGERHSDLHSDLHHGCPLVLPDLHNTLRWCLTILTVHSALRHTRYTDPCVLSPLYPGCTATEHAAGRTDKPMTVHVESTNDYSPRRQHRTILHTSTTPKLLARPRGHNGLASRPA